MALGEGAINTSMNRIDLVTTCIDGVLLDQGLPTLIPLMQAEEHWDGQDGIILAKAAWDGTEQKGATDKSLRDTWLLYRDISSTGRLISLTRYSLEAALQCT